jgi:DNA-binding transcriptional regulator YhcF (GntR family)
MDLVLSRRGGIAIRDQLRYQLELRILTGHLALGQQLPSVRALARRLKVHPNTVAAAYKDLEATGHVVVRKGAGVFVGPGPAAALPSSNLDDILRVALRQAFQAGHGSQDIRAGVDRWLGSAPVERVVVVDAAREMAQLLAAEVHEALGVVTASCTLMDAETTPSLLSGVLALTLPYHLETVSRLSAATAVEPLTLTIPECARDEVTALPPGSILLLVSCSPTVLPFAEVLVRSLMGDTIRVETHLLTATREWRSLAPVADLVLADVCSAQTVRGACRGRLRELRLISVDSVERLRPLAASLSQHVAATAQDVHGPRQGIS